MMSEIWVGRTVHLPEFLLMIREFSINELMVILLIIVSTNSYKILQLKLKPYAIPQNSREDIFFMIFAFQIGK
jgi:hypothetical protein